MKKYFFKSFLSIFSITVITLLIQSGILFFQYNSSQNSWKKQIYDEFVDSVENSIKDSTFPDFSITSLRSFMNQYQDNRVSGYIIEDNVNLSTFAIGKTSDGRILAQGSIGGVRKDSRLIESEQKHTKLNVVFEDNENFTIEKEKLDTRIEQLYIPYKINANDILGSVSVALNGTDVFVIHLLSFSPMTYAYSKDIIKSCLRSLIISVPICLIVSLVISWIISRKNAMFVEEIRDNLNELSNGKRNIKIKHNKNSELDEIVLAVEDLDKKLQTNEKSRQAWLNSISHDLNTPAAAIEMLIDGMLDGVLPKTKTNIIALKKESESLNYRINRVIEFSSLQSLTKIECSELETQSFINSLLKNTKLNGRDVLTEITTESIICDESLMVRACSELLKNALAFSDSEILIRVGKNGQETVFEVINEGVLNCDDPKILFEPWTKKDYSRNSEGNGLGLAIVGTIANLHNGHAIIEQLGEDRIRACITWTESI